MVGFIKAKRAKNIERPADTVGGFTARPSNIYDGTVELAYGYSSQSSDSQALKLQVKLLDGSKFYGTLWFAGADGNVYSTNDKGVKKFKKGYLLADSLAIFATEGEADLFDLETEPKTIKVKRDGKDVNETVESFPELEGLPIKLGLIQTEKYKQNFVDGEYINTDEIITVSELDQVFDEEGFTLNEWNDEADEPKFMDEWLATWKDKTRKAPKQAEPKRGLRKSTSEEGSNAKSRVAARKALPRRK